MSEFNHFFNKIILYFFFQKVAVSTPTLMNDAKFQKHLFLFFLYNNKNFKFVQYAYWIKLKIHFGHTDGNCIFPSTWNSTWYDSSMGDVIMSNSSSAITSGWTVTAYSEPVTSWTCVSENASDSIMLFKWEFNISKLVDVNYENITRLYFSLRLKNVSLSI